MSTWNQPRTLRITPLGLAAALGFPLALLIGLSAFAQDSSGGIAPRPEQEYQILEPHELVFVSTDRAQDMLNRLGNAGWIVPDGTQIIVHTFEPGTANSNTRYFLRAAGSYDEERQCLIIRRERR